MKSKTFLQILFTLIFIVSFNLPIASSFETDENAIGILMAEDAGEHDLYGFSIDTDGKWLVVGSKSAAQENGAIGAVYVYRRHRNADRWEYVQKIVPADGVPEGEFGESVVVSHSSLLIGARSMLASNGERSGVAYLYRYKGQKSGWVLETIVEPAEGVGGDGFGRSVALGPKHVIVGARFASNELGERSGAVYVYQQRTDGWQLQEKLLDPQGGEDDQFGRAIAFDPAQAGTLVVGSRNGISDANDLGKVLVFEEKKRDWQLSQTIMPEDSVDDDYFGQSVALAGNLLVVGARDANGRDDTKGTGAAYIYRRASAQDNYHFEQKVFAPDGKAKAQFGFAVAVDRLSATTLAVSARRADSETTNMTGQVYLYSYDRTKRNWSLDEIVAPESLEKNDEFGQSLALDPRGSWLAVGADQSSYANRASAGAVYILKNKIKANRNYCKPNDAISHNCR